jgi:hypothetical protein
MTKMVMTTRIPFDQISYIQRIVKFAGSTPKEMTNLMSINSSFYETVTTYSEKTWLECFETSSYWLDEKTKRYQPEQESAGKPWCEHINIKCNLLGSNCFWHHFFPDMVGNKHFFWLANMMFYNRTQDILCALKYSTKAKINWQSLLIVAKSAIQPEVIEFIKRQFDIDDMNLNCVDMHSIQRIFIVESYEKNTHAYCDAQ